MEFRYTIIQIFNLESLTNEDSKIFDEDITGNLYQLCCSLVNFQYDLILLSREDPKQDTNEEVEVATDYANDMC